MNTSLSRKDIRRKIDSVKHWWHKVEVLPGLFTPGEDDPKSRLYQMGIPEDLTGKTVLDIGAYDGFFSFYCERKGAEVTAIDVISPDECGFNVLKSILDSNVKHIQSTVYNLDPAKIGKFDVVLFFGVLYHLRHPLLALDKIYNICDDLLILESQICDEYLINSENQIVGSKSLSDEFCKMPFLQFYPNDELNGDPSNWFSPNEIALSKMIESCGFTVKKNFSNGVRAVFHGIKNEFLPWMNQYEVSAHYQKLPEVIERNKKI
jgi:tRNA (mo5U34)-methyltransferase